jgi:hypothetical protein
VSNQLAALVSEFVEFHSECLGEIDGWVPVPSPERRAPAAIIGRVASIKDRVADVLLPKRALDHGKFDATAFAVTGSGSDLRRVVVFDDTFTTGAAVFSAASALRAQGIEVAAAVVIGRHVNPLFAPNIRMLEWLRQTRWSRARCVLCGPSARSGTLF